MIQKTLLLSLLILFMSCKNSDSTSKTSDSAKNNTQEQNYTPVEHIEYYPSGIPKIKGTLIDNEREGKWFSYFENGSIKSTNTYVHNNLQGASYAFHSNGKMFYKGKYAKNIKVDKWYYYNEEGKLLKTLQYNTKGEVINETNH